MYVPCKTGAVTTDDFASVLLDTHPCLVWVMVNVHGWSAFSLQETVC